MPERVTFYILIGNCWNKVVVEVSEGCCKERLGIATRRFGGKLFRLQLHVIVSITTTTMASEIAGFALIAMLAEIFALTLLIARPRRARYLIFNMLLLLSEYQLHTGYIDACPFLCRSPGSA